MADKPPLIIIILGLAVVGLIIIINWILNNFYEFIFWTPWIIVLYFLSRRIHLY